MEIDKKKFKIFFKWMKFLENIIKYVVYLCKNLFIFSRSQKKFDMLFYITSFDWESY